jgi:hypothetical protein
VDGVGLGRIEGEEDEENGNQDGGQDPGVFEGVVGGPLCQAPCLAPLWLRAIFGVGLLQLGGRKDVSETACMVYRRVRPRGEDSWSSVPLGAAVLRL